MQNYESLYESGYSSVVVSLEELCNDKLTPIMTEKIDATIELEDGRWAAFEIRLGANQVDASVTQLTEFKNSIEKGKDGVPPFGIVCNMRYIQCCVSKTRWSLCGANYCIKKLKRRINMAEVYTLKIVYRDCDEKIWREAQVSSNSTLASVGYMVLATFDTLAYHLFNISYNGTTFELPNEDFDIEEDECLFYVKLSQLRLKVGDKLKMLYDFGCEQYFDIEVVDIQPMPKGSGRAYPKITNGEGKGILDDMPSDETLKIIKEIDKKGKTTHTYLTRYENECLWDYRDFDLKNENILLKGIIEQIAEGYEVFDEYV